MELIQLWVQGRYDNSAQATSDLKDDAIPDDLKHRQMFQLFVPVPVTVPAIPGYLVFQQSSADGSYDPESITRVGLLQFLPDLDLGVVRQRELNFKEPTAWRNAHLTPERLAGLTLADFVQDPRCDFLLRADPASTEIAGPMQPGACRIFSPGLNRILIADDAVTIKPAEYWFLGRFKDESGVVRWGNASPEPVKMIRLGPH